MAEVLVDLTSERVFSDHDSVDLNTLICKMEDVGLGRPLFLGGGCCDSEIRYAFGPGNFFESYMDTPLVVRESCVVIISNFVTNAKLREIECLIAALAPERWVVAFGNCPVKAIYVGSGDEFVDISQKITINYFLPGCPPTAKGLAEVFHRILADKLKMIKKEMIDANT